MADALQAALQKLLTRFDGVKQVAVTDREGVHIVSGGDQTQLQAFCSAFSLSAEQAGRLGLGRTQSIVTFLQDGVLLQFCFPPLVCSVLAAPDANLGVLMALQPMLKATLQPLCQSLQAEVM